MNTIPAPTLILPREEWPDADFDLPDGDLIHATADADSDKEDDEDWDVEMDFGRTGGAKVKAVVDGIAARSGAAPKGMVTIRPPLPVPDDLSSLEGDDDDEGISTIKVSALPNFPSKSSATPLTPSADDDIEAAFALPSELTQLSLRPLSLNHRASKNSLEWGDKDHTSSSTSSSDAYSSLGFNVEVSSSNSTTSASLPGTDDDEDDEDEGELEGLVIPSGLFESAHGTKQLTRILEMKKKMPRVEEQVKTASPDPEDDFEIGLVIDDDVDLSPSRLLLSAHHQSKRVGTLATRSKSAPIRPTVPARPPSRLRSERAKTPINYGSFLQQPNSRLTCISPTPPLRPPLPTRSQTVQSLTSAQSTHVLPTRSQTAQSLTHASPASTSLLAPKPGNLRGQKSYAGLKSPSPPSSAQRKLSRKASLSSLMEASNAQASGSGVASGSGQCDNPSHGYNAPTAASRARTHTHSTSRLHTLEQAIPPSRPSTPSSNPAALRLTMPTSLRVKSRTPISSVFPTSTTPGARMASPLPPRSPPRTSGTSRLMPTQIPSLPKLLRRTKRRMYGDGTELDAIEDLPTDRDKEAQFRVQPKGFQNRVPGGSYSKTEKDSGKGTIRKRREPSGGTFEPISQPSSAFLSLRNKQQRVDPPPKSESSTKKKKAQTSSSAPGQTKRKPTLIRNLGGAGAPKVVGEMKWNPQTLRWEGNDHVLRDFDSAVGTSARPALITHLTGSSIGSPAVSSFGSAARIVGNMIFDPARMCWMSTLAPEDDEPDVFADLADDEEDEDGWETKGGTIRANQQAAKASMTSDTSGSTSISGRLETPSPARSGHRRSLSESGSERGSRASMVCDVDDQFFDTCRRAEGRHRMEMKGWTVPVVATTAPDRSCLYDIRALATRQY